VVEASLISRDAILDAALQVADEHGLDAVSMYAVARKLQVEPIELHQHVVCTDDLLDGLVEALLTRYPLSVGEGTWDEGLRAMAAAIRRTAKTHPDVFPLLLMRPVITPVARDVRDGLYSVLRDSGLPEDAVPRAERLISTAVLGFAASEATGRFRMHTCAIIDADFAELLRWLIEAVSALRAAADAG